jgi:hypothetical protein
MSEGARRVVFWRAAVDEDNLAVEIFVDNHFDVFAPCFALAPSMVYLRFVKSHDKK